MSKQDELQYEQQEKRIQAQSDAFITLLTKRGILGDSQIDDAQKRAARQEKTKNCYHNTLMLLQHYRTLVWMLECFPETVAAELDRPFEGVDKLIEEVDVEVALGNKKIESRMQGMQKSRLLMDRLNEALTVLRKKPDNGERLYNLIYTTYIAPEALNHQEGLYRLGRYYFSTFAFPCHRQSCANFSPFYGHIHFSPSRSVSISSQKSTSGAAVAHRRMERMEMAC